MTEFTRRSFLRQTSIGVVGVGIAATATAVAMPRLAALSQQPHTATATATGALPASLMSETSLSDVALSGPMMVHVRDVATAEIAVLVGTQEIVYRDPELVARLVKSAGQAARVAG